MPAVIHIRPADYEDLPMLLAWRNHPSIRNFMFTTHEIDAREHYEWFERISKDSSHQVLIAQNDGVPFGQVQFSPVTDDGVAQWGFYVRPNAPKGSGRQLGVIALLYAFNHLRLYKVCGQAIAENEASIGLHKSLGFTQEEIPTLQKKILGLSQPFHKFGLLRNDWQRMNVIGEDIDFRN
jgi:UDP-4-amino-4,6-dideoxy-N-acetyl-beta-L-altrosamine N-acetyltransferase